MMRSMVMLNDMNVQANSFHIGGGGGETQWQGQGQRSRKDL